MKPPTSQKEEQKFIGVVNYYHNMWEINSHTLASFPKMSSSKVKLKWTKIKQDAFNEI